MEQEMIEKYKKAGQIAAQALEYGCGLIKPGVRVVDVCDKVEAKILELGGQMAFPAQISINDVAAHFCPEQDDPVAFKQGDMAKLDVGVHIDGYIGDTAKTVDLGDHKELLKASEEALEAALRLVKPGVTLGELGRAIQEVISGKGFSPIKNLSGHGLGHYDIHTYPTVPNFDTGDSSALKEGMVIAIEPFATNGQGAIYESSNPTIFSLIAFRPVRNRMTREVLRDIQDYQGLPFCTRWLQQKHSIGKIRFALKELAQLEMLREHPPLPDKAHGMVSQAEHSIIVMEKPIITTKI
jgi:methionyl aminopeptidase